MKTLKDYIVNENNFLRIQGLDKKHLLESGWMNMM